MKISANMITNAISCEKKFYHRYIAKTKPDENWVKPDYFVFGSALHKLLEISAWDIDRVRQNFAPIVESYQLDDTAIGRIAAAAKKVCEYIKKREPEQIFTEVSFYDEERELHGIIDAVLVLSNGFWIILDLKTTASFDENKEAMLANNVQVGLYLENIKLLAKQLDLDVSKYLWFVYLEVKKSLQRLKKDETVQEFIDRCESDTREIIINKSDIKINTYVRKVKDLMLTDNYLMNTFNCTSFGSSCEFFASCHGKNFIRKEKQE